MTPKQLSDSVGGMSFEEVLIAVRPLLESQARTYIHGFGRDDLEQELSVVVWRTQQTYDPTRGSFMNVLIRGFWNKLEHLRRQSRRQTQPVVALMCRTCGERRPVAWRPRCVCGARSFEEDRTPNALVAMVPFEDGDGDEEGPLAPYLAQEDPALTLVDEWWSLSPIEQTAALRRWNP